MTAPNTNADALVENTPFADLSLKSVKDMIPKEDSEALAENRAFVEGDHWQDGDGWIGPRFDDEAGGESDSGAASDETLDLIEQGFTSRNVTAEACERHDDAVTGITPTWGFGPRRTVTEDEPTTDQEQALIDEVEPAMRDFYDERDIDDLLSRFVITLLWAGRSAARIVIPEGVASDAGASEDEFVLPNVSTLEEALALLFPENLEPESSAMYIDPATRRQLGIAIVGEEANEEAEVYFLDESREVTIFERLTKSGDPIVVDMLLGGRLPFIEITRPMFITEQVREQQRALNLAQSMIPRNATTGGFLERLLLNAMPPGEWERDNNGNRTGRWIPGVYRVGSGTTNFVAGIPVEVTNADGSKRTELSTPSAIFRDPVPVQPARDASDEHYKAILSECDQLHVLIAGDATSSGVSRQHARADFIASVRKTGKRVNRVGRWLLETTLAMAEMLMGSPGKYTDTLRANFSVTYDYGPLSSDERAQNNADVKDGTMSRRTAMVRNNITDVAAENEEIDSQPSAIAARELAIATAVGGWVTAGADFDGACARLNLTPEEIAVLRPQFSQATIDTANLADALTGNPNDNPDVTGGGGTPADNTTADTTTVPPGDVTP